MRPVINLSLGLILCRRSNIKLKHLWALIFFYYHSAVDWMHYCCRMGALFVCIYPAQKINSMSKLGMFLSCKLQASEDQISYHMITDLNLNWSLTLTTLENVCTSCKRTYILNRAVKTYPHKSWIRTEWKRFQLITHTLLSEIWSLRSDRF